MNDTSALRLRLTQQFRGLSARHPAQWPVLPQMLCALGCILAVLLAGWFLVWDGQLQDLEAREQEERRLQDDYRAKVKQAVNLVVLRRQKEQASEIVASLEKQLPNKAEMDALLQDVSHAGQGRGLQFELFKPGQVVVREYYAELPIDVRITGSYHDLGGFASDVANLPRIVTLNNLSLLAGRDGVITLEAVAKTFRYLDQEEVAAQRKAAIEKRAVKK